MRKIFTVFIIGATMLSKAQESIIIDHNCFELSGIPDKWIEDAKDGLFIGYGHTSHGSQLTAGMDAIESYYTDGKYNWSHEGGQGELHLFEGSGYEEGYLDHDCGYEGWDEKTRVYLDSFPECNVIIWSWCGQVNNVDLLSHYLTPMEQLESDYPDVKFVYITGHLEGLGPDGSLFEANQQIREYCDTNNKILFDFADIEKYKPYCDTNYQQYFGEDNCDYVNPGGDTINWATNWLEKNPDHELAKISELCGSCAHSRSLNCIKKGIACWHLWARLAGWNGDLITANAENRGDIVTVYPNPVKDIIKINLPDKTGSITLGITDLQGKSVYKKNFKPAGEQIVLTDLNFYGGIYILQVSSETDVYRTKFIKLSPP